MNIYKLAYLISSHKNCEKLEKHTYSINGISITLNNITFVGNDLYIIFNFDENLVCIGFNNGISQPTVLCEFNASDIEENTFEINDYPWTKGGDHDN